MTYLVQHLLQEGLTANPAGIAVAQVDGETVSYAELDRLSNRYARILKSRGVERHDRVVICMEKCATYVAVVLGILKADAIYVPVYEKSPPSRLLQIVSDCSPKLLVTAESISGPIAEVLAALECSPRLLALTALTSPSAALGDSDPGREGDTPLAFRNTDQDIAYLLYTSGSTGQPKGVMVTHANVLDYAAWGKSYFSLSTADRILNSAPFYFDMSVFDIFCSLKSGATLCLVSENEYLFPGRLIDVAENYGVTIWKGVSSLLSYLSKTQAINSNRLKTLQKVIFAGEPLSPKFLAHWMRTYPGIRFYNGYGPTEATGISICHAVTGSVDAADSIPLGLPCDNTEISILSIDTRDACETGESGEICIRGAGVSAGYWNDPERTRQRFVEFDGPGQSTIRIYRTGDAGYIDEEGLVWFSGRLDDQVKVQGFRIELGDVSSAIAQLDGVAEATVLLLPDRAGNDSLVAFIEAAGEGDPGALRERLLASLPAYMAPKVWHRFGSLPRTERGKIDKTALRERHVASLQAKGTAA